MTLCEPPVDCTPIQLPDAVQDVAFGADQESIALPPAGMIGGSREIATGTPVPKRGMEGFVALVEMLRVAVRLPADAGVKDIVIVHVPPTSRLAQAEASAKDEAEGPEIDIELTDTADVPMLTIATVCATDCVETSSLPKVMLLALSAMAGPFADATANESENDVLPAEFDAVTT